MIDVLLKLSKQHKVNYEGIEGEEKGDIRSRARVLIEIITNNFPPDANGVLFNACASGNSDLIRLAIAGGANINAVDSDKKSPLTWALIHGNFSEAQLLVDLGADVDFEIERKSSLMHFACKHRILSWVDFLLMNNADIYGIDNNKNSLLHLLCQNGTLEDSNPSMHFSLAKVFGLSFAFAPTSDYVSNLLKREKTSFNQTEKKYSYAFLKR